ncbi:DUF1667 domain-containing protein [Acetobacterium bakii]|uniref:Transcriptional regulator n=1 Tax=Acetobacterium bakii TaxID=52689 RepID=A0A0L6TZ41_9FIRM|nr:DUF1667 domain-containing protein [Acetobacterium bakii]KNZ41541.1 transcriptional regulator [Acetobacterium bakii]
MERNMLCCTTCPSECVITVTKQGKDTLSIEGYTCKRGLKFAQKELTAPERTLTSTMIMMLGQQEFLIPVKSAQPIPKRSMVAAMNEIKRSKLQHACKRGDVLISDICGSGVDIVACKSIKEKNHAC